MRSTRTLRTTGTAIAATAALALALTACGTDSDPDTGGGDGGGESSEDAPLNVAAGPVPHAEILNFVRENLAEEAGLDLEVTEFTDYVLPNTALDSGEVDANFFQHKPYLDDFNENQGTDIVPVINVHLEPLGLYSNTLESADALAEGDTIAVPNDATNEGRALKLLADNGVIELADGVGAEATLADITDDRGLSFEELEAATLPRALDDFDAAIINGNYALEAGITPADDALVIEDSEGNPYANFLAVRAGDEDDPRVTTLAELLNTDEVRQFIEDTYQGSVVPAFGAPAA
ncbi:MetQ/NlpA family ABC transporter substrate-binding protein [Streptomyces radicis]|uniref:Lipoprotein n=1 Tax=Streptomyces radicis TaxID=1750517 RepID=A0A3A9WI49_9ACTN|nr:MetQ/NlpA family ABC transporter substrate-binding protein [Streptomyces radicis]RKN12698.1 ABC transporter substrate-binding protein [Streptomyces radicis]RKN27539.1 ABC transporter substrate-binding protein [Streptomyces radicis]